MKPNTKSSITLPPSELRVVRLLQKRLRARTKVEVVRRALDLLRKTTDRAELRRAFGEASAACRQSTLSEIAELDALTAEGLDE